MTDWIGYWEIDAPVSPEEQHADMQLLTQIQIPDGVTISYMTVWIHGREWKWVRVQAGTL